MSERIEYREVSPGFGSLMPHGSCNAVTTDDAVCGYPRRSDGTCMSPDRHPAQPTGDDQVSTVYDAWWAISGRELLAALQRAHEGEDPDMVYAELYANSCTEDDQGDDQ